MVSRGALPALQERTQDVPRIAVSCLWLGVIVAAVGLNMARYPGVSRMVGEVCQPQPAGTGAGGDKFTTCRKQSGGSAGATGDRRAAGGGEKSAPVDAQS